MQTFNTIFWIFFGAIVLWIAWGAISMIIGRPNTTPRASGPSIQPRSDVARNDGHEGTWGTGTVSTDTHSMQLGNPHGTDLAESGADESPGCDPTDASGADCGGGGESGGSDSGGGWDSGGGSWS